MVEWYLQMDNPELIDKYDGQLRQILLNMQHDGIRIEVIHFVFNQITEDIEEAVIAQGEINPNSR